jgi:hypothetical protein
MKNMKKFIYGLLAFSPLLALATTPKADIAFLGTAAGQLSRIVNILIPVAFGLAIIYFFWGLAQYIRSAGDPEAAAKGKSIMIYGIIAIAVMASMWGLVGWLASIFGVGGGTAPTIPSIDLRS